MESYFYLWHTFANFRDFLYIEDNQEVRQMKQKDYHIYLSEQERSQVIQSLIDLKNSLTVQGRYTDAVDEVLIKITKAKKKRIAVRYI